MKPRNMMSPMRILVFSLLVILVIAGFAYAQSVKVYDHKQGEGKKSVTWINPAGIVPGAGKKSDTWINPAGIVPGTGNKGYYWINPENYSITSPINAQLGETYVITLPENPTTGYQWEINVTNGLEILNDAYEADSNHTNLIGAGGNHSWTINTLQGGNQVFSGIYRRSWESVTGNESSFSQQFIVGNDVIMMDVPDINPSQTVIPVATSDSSLSGQSHLTISASTTSPTVGENIAITGRLTDQNGNGIAGATVTMDESGYSGPDPLTTTQTDSDGRFQFSVGVSYPYTVGMLVHYSGDGSYSATDSNTIMFAAHS